jgi:acetyltransferase
MVPMKFQQQPHVHRINPADLELERRFIHRLTPHTKRMRLLAAFGEPSEAQLIRLVSPDPDSELALAWIHNPVLKSKREQVGEFAAVARYALVDLERHVGEFAIVVADEFQGQGIGRKLLSALISAARQSDLDGLQGDCYADNRALISLCEGLGFEKQAHPEDATLQRVTLALSPFLNVGMQAKGAHAQHHARYQ